MPSQEVKDHYIDLDGLKVHYREWGSRQSSPIVVLHAAELWGRSYDLLASQLSDSHRVLVLDQRGHGETDWVSDYEWHNWIDDVARFADAMRFRTFDLIGHSMGGAIAGRYAGAHPDRVSHLILLDSWYSGIEYSKEWDDYWPRAERMNAEGGFGSAEEYVTNLLTLFPRLDRRVAQSEAEGLLADDAGRLRKPIDPRHTWASQPSEDSEHQLRETATSPTLVVQGEISELHIPGDNRRVATLYPDGQAAVVPNAGHNLHGENTAFTVDLILNFISP